MRAAFVTARAGSRTFHNDHRTARYAASQDRPSAASARPHCRPADRVCGGRRRSRQCRGTRRGPRSPTAGRQTGTPRSALRVAPDAARRGCPPVPRRREPGWRPAGGAVPDGSPTPSIRQPQQPRGPGPQGSSCRSRRRRRSRPPARGSRSEPAVSGHAEPCPSPARYVVRLDEADVGASVWTKAAKVSNSATEALPPYEAAMLANAAGACRSAPSTTSSHLEGTGRVLLTHHPSLPASVDGPSVAALKEFPSPTSGASTSRPSSRSEDA